MPCGVTCAAVAAAATFEQTRDLAKRLWLGPGMNAAAFHASCLELIEVQVDELVFCAHSSRVPHAVLVMLAFLRCNM